MEDRLGAITVPCFRRLKGRCVMRFNWLDWIAIVLVIVGAINWGLVGIFNFNLVEAIFGAVPALVTTVYILVGLAGLYMIYLVSREAQYVERPSR